MDFLDVEKIKHILELPLQDKVQQLAELKTQARKHSLTTEFNNLVKLLSEEKSTERTAELIPLERVPKVIKNTAGYTLSEYGVFLPMNNSDMEICPYPIFPIERFVDIEDNTEQLKLTYKRDNKWHELIYSRATLASASKIIQLADKGTGINSENAKAVVRYMSDIESYNRDSIPITKSISHLGWTEYGFVPFVDDIKFTGLEQYDQLYSKFHTKGDESVWLELSKLCLEHPIPRIIVAASYASLLLKKIGVNGFCVHLWGESGRGKTVALMLGASIYGDTDPKNGIIRNGKTTSNAIEPVLDFFKDCPVYFDELTTLSQEQITDMIYKFAQGQGKGRMTRAAGLQKTYTWNNVAILSAEKPLTDNRTNSGAINRIISIYTDGAVFGDLNMVYIANILKENYGFGAKKFIEALKNIDIEVLFQSYIQEIPDNIEAKQANAAALLLTAYDIACTYLYKIPNKLTSDSLIQFLQSKEFVSISNRAYDDLLAYAEANYTLFDESEILQSKWGLRNDRYLHIFYTRFVEWCQKNGYQEMALLKEWRTRGLIKTRNKNEFKNNARIKGELRSDVISLVIHMNDHRYEIP